MKHVTMELGGKSPMLVFDDADLEDAVGGAIMGTSTPRGRSAPTARGSSCRRASASRSSKRLAERLGGAVIGDPMDRDHEFRPDGVSERQIGDRAAATSPRSSRRGARLVCGGERLDQPGFWLTPAIFDGVTDDMTIAREEIFGPVLSVLEFETEEEGIARANATEFGLSAGVFTRDISRAHRVIAQLRGGHMLHQFLQRRAGRDAVRRHEDVGGRPREFQGGDRALLPGEVGLRADGPDGGAVLTIAAACPAPESARPPTRLSGAGRRSRAGHAF